MGATQQAAGQAQEKAQEVAGQVQDKAQEASAQARSRAREQVDQRSTQFGQQASTTAQDLRGVAHYLRSQNKDQPAKVADQAAERVQKVGGYLEQANSDRILHDVENFGRSKPWAVAAGGLTLGFLASRFLKASSTERYRSSTATRLQGSPQVHTAPSAGHPAGDGVRTTRDIGGPVAAPDAPVNPGPGVTAAPGTPPGSGFPPHR